MRLVRSAAVVLASVALVVVAQPAGAGPPDEADALQVFNRDVYVIEGSTLRNPTTDTDPDAPLYSNVGAGLPATWGSWSAATAESVARRTGQGTDIRLEFANLIPNGVYSVFWLTLQPDSEHPDCPGVERALPLTAFKAAAQEPDPSSFVAGAEGTASYRGVAPADFLDAGQAVVELIYHFDGDPHHPFPNRGEFFTHTGDTCRSSFGEDAMRQLIIFQKYQ